MTSHISGPHRKAILRSSLARSADRDERMHTDEMFLHSQRSVPGLVANEILAPPPGTAPVETF